MIDTKKDDKEFQKVLKELHLDDKQPVQLTMQDLARVYGYMQEIYCLE